MSQTTPVIDHAMLARVCGADAGIQRQLLAEFRRVNDADAARLFQHLEDGTMAPTVKLLHRIKGAARGLAAVELVAACERMESSARSGGIGEQDRQQFRDALLRLNAYLDSIGVRG